MSAAAKTVTRLAPFQEQYSQTLDQAFPDVDPGMRPFGHRVLCAERHYGLIPSSGSPSESSGVSGGSGGPAWSASGR